jgi:hypothetical protein
VEEAHFKIVSLALLTPDDAVNYYEACSQAGSQSSNWMKKQDLA